MDVKKNKTNLEKFRKGIEEARADKRAGRVKSQEEVEKELGL